MSIDCPCCKTPILSEDQEGPSKPLFLPCGHCFCGRPECLEKLSELKEDDSRLKLKIYVITCPNCHNIPYKITIVHNKTLYDFLSECDEVNTLKSAIDTVYAVHSAKKGRSTCKACNTEYTKYCATCDKNFCPKCSAGDHEGHKIFDIHATMRDAGDCVEKCTKVMSHAAISGEGDYDVTDKLYNEYVKGIEQIEKTFDELISDIKKKKKETLETTTKMYYDYFSKVNTTIQQNKNSIGTATAAKIVLENIKERRKYGPILEWKEKAIENAKKFDNFNFSKEIRDIPYRKQLKLVFNWSQQNPKLEKVDVTYVASTFTAFNNFGMFTIRSNPVLQQSTNRMATKEGQFNQFVPSGVQPKGDGPYTACFRIDANSQNYVLSEDRLTVEASKEGKNDSNNYNTIILGDAPLPPESVVTFAFKVDKMFVTSGIFVGVSTNEFDFERQKNWKKSGWFFHTSSGMLFSGLPHKYSGKVYSTPKKTKVGDVIYAVFNANEGSLAFKVKHVNTDEVVDFGIAYKDIPMSKDKPVYPAAILGRGCSITLVK